MIDYPPFIAESEIEMDILSKNKVNHYIKNTLGNQF
jgi:hypothetical protein